MLSILMWFVSEFLRNWKIVHRYNTFATYENWRFIEWEGGEKSLKKKNKQKRTILNRLSKVDETTTLHRTGFNMYKMKLDWKPQLNFNLEIGRLCIWVRRPASSVRICNLLCFEFILPNDAWLIYWISNCKILLLIYWCGSRSRFSMSVFYALMPSKREFRGPIENSQLIQLWIFDNNRIQQLQLQLQLHSI